MTTVYTARLSYGEEGRLDITIAHAAAEWKAGRRAEGAIFAPDTAAFDAVKHGRISVARYFELYQERLGSIRGHARSMLDSRMVDRIVGVCFCVGAAQCHRTVWRAFMVELGATDGGELPAEEQRRVVTRAQRELF